MKDEGGGMNKKELKRQHAIVSLLLIPYPSSLIPLSPAQLKQAVLTSLCRVELQILR